MIPYEQTPFSSGKEELHLNGERPWAELGSARDSRLEKEEEKEDHEQQTEQNTISWNIQYAIIFDLEYLCAVLRG